MFHSGILVAASFSALALAFAAPVLGQRDAGNIAAIGNAITYQGVLKQGGSPLNGTCDLQVSLWNALSAGTQIGTTQTFLAQSVTAGQINVSPDFGTGAYDGNDRWIQMAVRAPAGGGLYTTLTPRQKLSPVPYALFSVGGNTGVALPWAATASVVSNALIQMTNTHTNGGGLYGVGSVYGVHGGNISNGNYGQLGTANYGVYGLNNATQADGRLGSAAAGVNGAATLNNGTVGVYGSHIPTGNYGQLGTSDSGVVGIGNVFGVYGNSPNHGGRFVATGSGGRAVLATATTIDGVGVIGENGPTGNYGRLGADIFGVDGHHASGHIGFLATASAGAEGHSPAGNSGQLGTDEAGVFGSAGGTSVAVKGIKGASTGELGTGGTGVRGVYSSGGPTNTGLLGHATAGVFAHSTTSVALYRE